MANKQKKGSQAKNTSKSLIVAIVVLAVAIAVLVVCAIAMIGSENSTSFGETTSAVSVEPTVSQTQQPFTDFDDTCSYVQIEMEDGGVIVLELYPQTAPITVANFMDLVSDGFYDGLTFHRVIPGFMVQGGDPKGDGTGGPGTTIFGEFSANGFDNPLKHERGVISMARATGPDTAGSQFFICTDTAGVKHLDGNYAAFGRVVSGMEVVDRIESVTTGVSNKPLTPVVMKKVTVLHTAGESAASKAAAE